MAAHFQPEKVAALELVQLEECIYWREVGRDIIQRLNLTSMQSGSSSSNSSTRDCCSHLLVSIHDFVQMIDANKGLGIKLLQRLPDVARLWVQGTSLYTGLVKVLDTAMQHAIMIYLDLLWHKYLGGGKNASTLNATLLS